MLSSANDGGYELESGTSMAAPHAAGVAALMAAMRPDLSASELRAQLLQNAGACLAAGRRRLPGCAQLGRQGRERVHVPAGTAAARAGASAQRKGSQTVVQVAALGDTRRVARYRLSLDRRRAAEVRKGSSPFTVRLRGRAGRKLRVDALDAAGKKIASGTRRGPGGAQGQARRPPRLGRRHAGR